MSRTLHTAGITEKSRRQEALGSSRGAMTATEISMGFINISEFQPIEPVPGCRMRTPFGKNLMLSHLEMDEGAEVPLHSHPHEQGGMLIRGTLELTIGDETRLCQPGSMFLIPPNVKHRAVAVGGPCLVLDVFSPVREDYAELVNHYIPPVGKTES